MNLVIDWVTVVDVLNFNSMIHHYSLYIKMIVNGDGHYMTKCDIYYHDIILDKHCYYFSLFYY